MKLILVLAAGLAFGGDYKEVYEAHNPQHHDFGKGKGWTPPIETPEPSTAVLSCLGLAAIAAVGLARRK